MGKLQECRAYQVIVTECSRLPCSTSAPACFVGGLREPAHASPTAKVVLGHCWGKCSLRVWHLRGPPVEPQSDDKPDATTTDDDKLAEAGGSSSRICRFKRCIS